MTELVHDPRLAVIDDYGGAPVCTHNLACQTCHKNKAVYDLSRGVFLPCWTCQRLNRPSLLRRVRNWLSRAGVA